MKRFYCISVFMAVISTAFAQSRDTSYSIYNEYQKNLKNYPYLQPVKDLEGDLVQVKKGIAYCKPGKRELLLDVFSPTQRPAKKRPAIIFIHGGGWRSGHRSMHYPLAQRLAALGYVCITPEYRLSPEALYPAAVHDIKASIRWARKNAAVWQIDTSAIVIAGHSAGGELAAFMGATNGITAFEGDGCNKKFSSRVNAVIDIDGTLAFIHPESGEGDDSKKISAATQWFGYSKTEKPERWKEAAPLTHAGAHTAPVLFINSSVARMHAGREDFIAVLDRYKIYSEIKTFAGSPHAFILFNPWFDSTIVYMDQFIKKIFPAYRSLAVNRITVSQNGNAMFSTLQSAFDAVPRDNRVAVSILLGEGIYKQKVLLDPTKNFITLTGADKMKTAISWNDHTGKLAPNGDTINTRTSWTFKILANDFTASNITFLNDAGFSAGQAVAVESDGDRITFTNCRFIGNQDVLFLNNEKSRQFFQSCYIEGTTDFIFGSGTAWFEKCNIYSKKNSHITAASTPADKEWGFVFNDCRLEGDTSLHNVSLGRPWRPYAAVVYMHCYIGPHIRPEGWSNWNNTENDKTARYAEYKNYGPSSDPSKRVKWSKQLTDAEARKYSAKKYRESWFKANR